MCHIWFFPFFSLLHLPEYLPPHHLVLLSDWVELVMYHLGPGVRSPCPGCCDSNPHGFSFHIIYCAIWFPNIFLSLPVSKYFTSSSCLVEIKTDHIYWTLRIKYENFYQMLLMFHTDRNCQRQTDYVYYTLRIEYEITVVARFVPSMQTCIWYLVAYIPWKDRNCQRQTDYV